MWGLIRRESGRTAGLVEEHNPWSGRWYWEFCIFLCIKCVGLLETIRLFRFIRFIIVGIDQTRPIGREVRWEEFQIIRKYLPSVAQGEIIYGTPGMSSVTIYSINTPLSSSGLLATLYLPGGLRLDPPEACDMK